MHNIKSDFIDILLGSLVYLFGANELPLKSAAPFSNGKPSPSSLYVELLGDNPIMSLEISLSLFKFHPSGIIPSSLSTIFPPLDLSGFPSSFGNSKSTNQRLNKVWASSSSLFWILRLLFSFSYIASNIRVILFCILNEGNCISKDFKEFIVIAC